MQTCFLDVYDHPTDRSAIERKFYFFIFASADQCRATGMLCGDISRIGIVPIWRKKDDSNSGFVADLHLHAISDCNGDISRQLRSIVP